MIAVNSPVQVLCSRIDFWFFMEDQIGNMSGSVSSKSLDVERKYGTQDGTNKNNLVLLHSLFLTNMVWE